MLRECVTAWLCVQAAGCSLVLDFSDQAIPRDAAPDAPYSAEECAYKEPNDSAQTAAPIALSDEGPAAICAGAAPDHDFYRFTVPSGATAIELRVESMYRPTGDLDLRLYEAGGANVLAQSHNFSDQERLACPGSVPICPALAAGDYVFEVFPAITGAVNRYTFALVVAP